VAETLAALAPIHALIKRSSQKEDRSLLLSFLESLLSLLAAQLASPGYRLSLCRGLSLSGFAPHLVSLPVIGPLNDVAGDVLGSKTER
jgi:hypothetical protein